MSSSGDLILLLTHSGDFFTIDRVAEALSKKGARPFRFDTDKFPLEVQLRAQFDQSQSSYRLKYGTEVISSEDVKAVWMRRIWQPNLGENLDPQFQESCIRESSATLSGLWDSLRGVRWIDDLAKAGAANNKQRQLRVASEVGLVIPKTLITNDPEAVREFFQQVKGKMVTKLLKALSYSMEYTPFFLYTSIVKEDDLLDAESLRYCPMVFQEQIPKQLELRVIFVQGKVFVGALDSSIYEKSTVDWRRPNTDVGVWQHHELPDEIVARIKALMDNFGLLYGALDFIVTPSGDYVFLEVNPGGEWGMLERDLELPISNAIAEALIS
ncbi:MvdC family ATP-grasp ribosomal peptide maturase [Moorena producens PAL-8-15-08-1]|uniref:MvdC family ATP-grasp ribosomal peptide maturase n=1 Tax=Moorena producens PAL-8-15-08-1 TaxID=1458985 RepID=A0A1D8TYN8_9CYAN|nr:MvdC family ATP-grasp ribosomal peptide maturase [Moorena producens]AOX02556.1 MvdC family ATP-grasp ribosomal peptide maturase [Moorena producens PAL-8-15-08-1]